MADGREEYQIDPSKFGGTTTAEKLIGAARTTLTARTASRVITCRLRCQPFKHHKKRSMYTIVCS